MAGARSSRPLTFGVEFEFSLATIQDRFEIDVPDESRTLRFTPSQSDINRTDDCFLVTKRTIQDHISKTLTDAGYPCVPGYQDDNRNYLSWEIKEDGSIDPPAPHETIFQYEWFKMELTSPVFFYCEESLHEVMEICYLITNNYCVNVNESTGLHVHVGNGLDNGGKFSFSTLRALHAFLWAFEPQLNMLHPSHRQNDRYFRSMRAMTHWKGKHGHVPEPLDGITAFLRAKTPQQLADLTNAHFGGNAYNFFYSLEGCEDILPTSKKTIEFRQHESTLEPERVKYWIKTVVGIVEYCRDAEFYPTDFTQLLLKVEKEEIRDPKEKPQLCESGFTVIDLLIELKLYPSALFYKHRGVYGPHRPDYYWPTDKKKGLAEQIWDKYMALQEAGELPPPSELPKVKRLVDEIYDKHMRLLHTSKAPKEKSRERPENKSTPSSTALGLPVVPEELEGGEEGEESEEEEPPEPENKSVYPSYPSF